MQKPRTKTNFWCNDVKHIYQRKKEHFNLLTVKHPTDNLYQENTMTANNIVGDYKSEKENDLKRSGNNRLHQKFQKKTTNETSSISKDFNKDQQSTSNKYKIKQSAEVKDKTDGKTHNDKRYKETANTINSNKKRASWKKTEINFKKTTSNKFSE